MKQQKPPAGPPAFIVSTLKSLQAAVLNFAAKLAPPYIQVLDLAAGMMGTQVIYVAAKLGLADKLKKGPKSVDELAKETETNSDALYRLLRALSSLGVFKETSDKLFDLTPAAESLQADHHTSVRPLALLVGDPIWRDPWANIEHSVKTGEDGFQHVYGKGFFDYLSENKEKSDLFNNWMTKISNMNCPVIAQSYPFNKFSKIVDIGGGHGSLIYNILKCHPSVEGVLFDQPDVVSSATELNGELASRCELVGGDFFESVPKGGDIYIMQQIIHDWSDELAVKILSNCKDAMNDNGRVLVVDALIKPGNGRDINKFIDLQMLLINKGGKERTEQEFRSLFDSAGLEMTRVISTAAMFSMVEGKKQLKR
jgi:hypothetical protein